MSKSTEQTDFVPNIFREQQYDLIKKIHQRLHKDQAKAEEVSDTRVKYEEEDTPPQQLTRADVRKILGDPLPLPYKIYKRNTIDEVAPSQRGPPSPTGVLFQKGKQPLSTEAHNRLQDSIRKLQKLDANNAKEESTTPFETIPVTSLSKALELEIPMARDKFKTPSPPSISTRIRNSNAQRRLLQRFHAEMEPKVMKIPNKGLLSESANVGRGRSIITLAVFFTLLFCLHYALTQR